MVFNRFWFSTIQHYDIRLLLPLLGGNVKADSASIRMTFRRRLMQAADNPVSSAHVERFRVFPKAVILKLLRRFLDCSLRVAQRQFVGV